MGLGIAAVRDAGPEASGIPALYAAYCTPVPAAAVVAPGETADRVIDVAVPPRAQMPGTDAPARRSRIHRGDVVELRIIAPVAGAASVHGLSDLVVMRPGEPATLRFRAIHGGRFPLHFHGADGSHEGVWALDITSRPS